jgi:hypothetical protein
VNSDVPVGDAFYWDRIVCKEVTRVGNSPDLQTTQDMILNGLLGGAGYTGQGTGNLPTQARGGLDSIYANVLNLTAQVQSLSSNNNAASNSGISITINFSDYPDGNLPSVFSVTYTGSGTSLLGITSGQGGWRTKVNDANRSARASYNPQATLSDYQIIRGTLAGLPEQGGAGGTPKIGVMGRLNSTATPVTFVWGRGYCTGFLTYKGEMGCTVNNVETVWVSNIALNWSTDIRCVFGVGTTARRYQFYSGTSLIYDYTEVGTTSQMGAGFRNFGLTCDICTVSSGTPKGPGTLANAAISDNAPPTVVGSGCKLIRQNTAGVAFAAGATSTDFPANFFDAIQASSADMTGTLSNGRITVSNAGWYIVVAGIAITSSNSARLGLGIKQNGAMEFFGTGTYSPARGHSICTVMYLNAGEYVNACYSNSDISNWNVVGVADGSQTFLSVVLANRSYA